MQECEAKVLIQAAASTLVDPALRLIEQDPHQWSKRPCTTCQTVSSLINRPFGCVRYARDGEAIFSRPEANPKRADLDDLTPEQIAANHNRRNG